MRKSLRTFVTTAAATLGLLLPLEARATGIYSASVQSCSAAIESETAKLVQVVHEQIRTSIAANMKAESPECSGALVCAGGANNGKPCSDNSVWLRTGPGRPTTLSMRASPVVPAQARPTNYR